LGVGSWELGVKGISLESNDPESYLNPATPPIATSD
jgi:hypothetical protein